MDPAWSEHAWIEISLYPKYSQNHISHQSQCYSARFIRTSHNLKDFHSVLFVRIKRDPPRLSKQAWEWPRMCLQNTPLVHTCACVLSSLCDQWQHVHAAIFGQLLIFAWSEFLNLCFYKAMNWFFNKTGNHWKVGNLSINGSWTTSWRFRLRRGHGGTKTVHAVRQPKSPWTGNFSTKCRNCLQNRIPGGHLQTSHMHWMPDHAYLCPTRKVHVPSIDHQESGRPKPKALESLWIIWFEKLAGCSKTFPRKSRSLDKFAEHVCRHDTKSLGKHQWTLHCGQGTQHRSPGLGEPVGGWVRPGSVEAPGTPWPQTVRNGCLATAK